MGFYQDQIVPLLINLAMRRRDLAVYRSRVVPAADGRVLEVRPQPAFLFAQCGTPHRSWSLAKATLHATAKSASQYAFARTDRGVSRSHPTRQQQRRRGGDHMDLVQHSGCCPRASRSASGPQVNRTPPLYRTRARPRAERTLVAGSSNSGLETYRRWLPSQPRDPESHRRCWFPI